MSNAKKIFFLFLLLTPVLTAVGQIDIKLKDIKIEDDVVYYQGTKQFIIQDKMVMSEVYIKDVNTAEIIISLVLRKAPSIEGPTKANPDGLDAYYEFTYLKTNAKCDYRSTGFGGKREISKDFLNYGLFVNATVNEDNINKFISIKGSPYTNRNNQTIIIR